MLPPTGPAVADASAFDVSVVIATRNRAALLTRALGSVMAQREVRVQAIVVDDGSAPDQARMVQAAVAACGPAAQLLRLPARDAGHGPSYARNSAAAQATGRLLAFLDDDDEWTDPHHLRRSVASLGAWPSGGGGTADVLFGDQRALHPDGREHTGPLWLRGLDTRLRTLPDAQGAREADVRSLLAAGGMCHLNTVVMRRHFFQTLGGFDERLRYEEDRDLCLRAIDAAQRMLFQPALIGVHHIPDRTQRQNVTTAMADHDKRLAQLLLLEKAQLTCRQSVCRRYARVAKGQVLKHLAVSMAQAQRPRDAQAYRLQALGLDFSLKWLAYTALGALRTIGSST
ncbi:MAG: glycosyltransferase [Burkholderiaceae bacterium]|nr:glycosyltransferase [Rhodoferax sp.]MCP5271931.1 glycosyltransferase [Burkholderiaceae bacterium]